MLLLIFLIETKSSKVLASMLLKEKRGEEFSSVNMLCERAWRNYKIIYKVSDSMSPCLLVRTSRVQTL